MQSSGGKKESTYVDDVFSTYLYYGTTAAQTIENGLKLGNNNVGGSVEFQESSVDKLSFASTSDFTFGTGDFTIECFVNYNAISNDGIFQLSSTAGGITTGSALSLNVLSQDSGKYSVYFKNIQNVTSAPGTCNNAVVNTGQWYHLAMVRQSGQSRFFVNGLAQVFGTDCTNDITITDTTNYTWTDLGLGGYYDNSFLLNGRISNFRITKGQALYWSNFTAPTQALTTTSQGATASNVKLLCCNKGTLTGKTVGPTITSSGSPTASGFGPFTGTGGEGGLTWIKARNNTNTYALIDTVRGAGKMLATNNSSASTVEDLSSLSSFNANGFSLGNESGGYQRVNMNGQDYTSWSFRKTTGFFDVLTYTGNGSARTLAHSLGSIPGMIIVKKTNASDPWYVYHRSLDTTNPENYKIFLDESDTRSGANINIWNETKPTSTHFSLGSNDQLNGNGNSYVAYVFAGGESTADTARSVDFTPNANANLELSGSTDFEPGTGDYSIEAWINTTFTGTTRQIIFYSGGADNGSLTLGIAADQIYIANYNAYILQANSGYAANNPSGQWIHVAACRSGSTLKIFKNGIEVKSGTSTNNWNTSAGSTAKIGHGGSLGVKGKLSNVRFVKGTAVYTSSFRPSTEPLTNITNTKLLCCNNSSASGATVTPNTITATNSAAASTDSPFDDPEGFKFGEEGDQNIIKCGGYSGDGTKNHDIYLGWEPSWVMIKCTTAGENWLLFDVMRGIVTDGNSGLDAKLSPNITGSEVTNSYNLEVTGTGFKLTQDQAHINSSGNSYIFTAIRRPDGYVGKPVEAGTDVFAMAYGNSAGTKSIICF